MAKDKQAPLLNVESAFKDKKLETLADKFTELRDEKAGLAEQMTETEKKIVERMTELKFTTFRYADKLVTLKQGGVHVKVKSVTNDGVESDAE